MQGFTAVSELKHVVRLIMAFAFPWIFAASDSQPNE